MSGYDQYRQQSFKSMTKGELLILLYEENIKCLKRSKLNLADNDFENFDANMNKAKKIINELSKSLDMKYPLSSNLFRMYEFISLQLSKAQAGRKLEHIDDVLPLVEELRDSFREANSMKK